MPTAKKIRYFIWVVTNTVLLGCARPEDSSFAGQAVRRGDDCNTIAAGHAMDAYGHSVGPATEIYAYAYQNCLAWQQKQTKDRNAAP